MAKFNLADAAKAVLNEGSKDTFDSNIRAKMGQRELSNPEKVGSSRLKSSTAYGTNDAGEIGQSPERGWEHDQLPDYTKGTPQATPPGATPPVGSEKDGVGITKATGPQDHMGRSDISKPNKLDATSYENIRDRIAGKLPNQTFGMNAGATFQHYDGTHTAGHQSQPTMPGGAMEEVEYDDDMIEEEEDEKMQEASNAYTQTSGYPAFKKKKPASKEVAKVADTKRKETMKEKMKEDIDALLQGENLSEEFVAKASTIFEAAVISRAEEVIEEAQNELMEQFEVAIEIYKEELANKVDDYLNYMVEEWLNDNQIAIEKGLRAEIAEGFMNSLRDLFTEHYIDVPTEKVDIAEELAIKCEELEEQLNEQINKGIELSKALNEQKKIEAIYTACEGLTQTQVEKMKALAESVDFTTEEEFVGKMEVLKESYFKPTDVKIADQSSYEEVLVEEEKKTVKSSDPSMDVYAKAISQSLAK